MHGYWHSTRHPWPCLLFVLPLLFLYEGFMLWQAMEGYAPARAGLDAWLASVLRGHGLGLEYLPSLLILLICISWAVIKWDKSSPETLSTWAGMGLESILYALALWGLGALLTAGLRGLSIYSKGSLAVTYIGCGIFEEVIFRLLLFGTLVYLFRAVAEERTAVGTAILLSAVGFAAAHFVGPHADAWELRSFLFRTMAGVVFAALLTWRGLGITVGTHSAYNLIVGLHS